MLKDYESRSKLGTPGRSDLGLMGVDWEERINFDRMRRQRLQRLKDALNKTDIDMLFVFRTEDARYTVGFRHHLGPAFVIGNVTIVLAKNAEPILFTQDWPQMRISMPWLADEQLQPRANLREGVEGAQVWVDRLKGLLGSDLKNQKIGVDIWTPGMGKIFQSALPTCEFVDGYPVMLEAKKIKTVDEIQCLKAANSITEAAMDAAIRALRPGIRECEVLSIAWQTMTALGSEWTQCANIVASGPYTAPYRRFTSDRIIRLGDPVVIDIGGCFAGYYGDLTRTVLCGDIIPTPRQRELFQSTYFAVFNSCEQCRVGNTTADVYQAAKPCILTDMLGHGAGTNPWESPHFSSLAEKHPVPLEAGMAINLEPYAGEPGVGGFRLENNLIVTDGDPDIYTTYPYDERFLDEVHRLDQTTGRTSERLNGRVRGRRAVSVT
jgi:Xaa-Pro aminopeptidase